MLHDRFNCVIIERCFMIKFSCISIKGRFMANSIVTSSRDVSWSDPHYQEMLHSWFDHIIIKEHFIIRFYNIVIRGHFLVVFNRVTIKGCFMIDSIIIVKRLFKVKFNCIAREMLYGQYIISSSRNASRLVQRHHCREILYG